MFRKAPPYVTISAVFFILIGMGLAYSYFFYPDQHPIPCMVKAYTGKTCPTCGFSRSFSFYTHLQFSEGKKSNPLSWPVFLFFVFQFALRGGVIIYYAWRCNPFSPPVIISDAIISISLFLLAFLPIILKA
jgi:hypothetical protein